MAILGQMTCRQTSELVARIGGSRFPNSFDGLFDWTIPYQACLGESETIQFENIDGPLNLVHGNPRSFALLDVRNDADLVRGLFIGKDAGKYGDLVGGREPFPLPHNFLYSRHNSDFLERGVHNDPETGQDGFVSPPCMPTISSTSPMHGYAKDGSAMKERFWGGNGPPDDHRLESNRFRNRRRVHPVPRTKTHLAVVHNRHVLCF